MSYEWLEMQREAERHQAIEQYLRKQLAGDVYGGSPHRGIGIGGSPGTLPMGSPQPNMHLAGAGGGYAGGQMMGQFMQGGMGAAVPLGPGDKVRATFQDLDYNKNGVVDIEEFKRGMEECRLDFTDPTSTDLFNKAKMGKTGDLTEPEWYRFITQYPMLLDALYHRFREAANAKREAEAARSAQERLNDRLNSLRTETENAERALSEQEAKAHEEDSKMKDVADTAKSSEEAHRNAVELVGIAFKERQETEKRVAAEWEATRAQRIAAAEAARDADVAERRLAAAEERERWAMQALEAAKKEKEQALQDLEASKARQIEVKPTEDPEVLLGEADRKVADAQRKEYELGVAAAEEAAKADRLRWSRDEQERLRAGCEARLNRARDALAEAEKASSENEERLREAESVMSNGVTADDKENQLVEQEVRLKEQRECLEEKENMLKKECNEYTKRGSPSRERLSYSPNYSYATPTK
ncbi:hypothetical protein DIPPA_08450 [Diplonema papillatum]|nr:hypothetical protein DIPPA_08450 [Diplonema papillatum]